METLNNGNGMLLSPPHNNHHQQQQSPQQQQQLSQQQQQHQQQHQRQHAVVSSSSVGNSASSSVVMGAACSTTSSSSSAAASAASGIAAGEHNIQITQPISAPSSPLASPGAISSSTSFCMPSSSTATATSSSGGSGSYVCSAVQQYAGGANGATSAAGMGSTNVIDTADPNWQATKATVLERNAAMFNNELMSDVKFVVGGDFGKYNKFQAFELCIIWIYIYLRCCSNHTSSQIYFGHWQFSILCHVLWWSGRE